MDAEVSDIRPMHPWHPYPKSDETPKPATKTTTYKCTNNQDIQMNKQTYLFIYTRNKKKVS